MVNEKVKQKIKNNTGLTAGYFDDTEKESMEMFGYSFGGADTLRIIITSAQHTCRKYESDEWWELHQHHFASKVAKMVRTFLERLKDRPDILEVFKEHPGETGHNIYLTARGAGVGFWDGDWHKDKPPRSGMGVINAFTTEQVNTVCEACEGLADWAI